MSLAGIASFTFEHSIYKSVLEKTIIDVKNKGTVVFIY